MAELAEGATQMVLGDLERPRAKSLIVTVYGDSILPNGDSCWLGDLIALLTPFGLNERMTRTAVFRLVQDGILEAERFGRRSRYTLTRDGRRQFDSAQARIYAAQRTPQADGWTFIVLPDSLPASDRDALTRELGWQGFARLSPGLLASARGDANSGAGSVLIDLGLSEICPVFVAEPAADNGLPALAAQAWPLGELATEYRRFVSAFEPYRHAKLPSDDGAYVLRTLLIHHYRRALLRDPALPDALLPADWPGHLARELSQSLYLALSPAADRHLAETLELPPCAPSCSARFT